MTRTVVLAIDDSEHSEYAFDFYLKHLLVKGDNIVVVHVSEYHSVVQAPAVLNDPFVVSQLIKEEEAKVKVLIDKYSKKLKSFQLGGRVKQMVGKSGEAIVAAAQTEGASLIVMGSRGLGKLRRTLIGSVSDYVLHHAHVPVVICRKPQPEGAQH
ncbi:hypothetical protein EGW08_013081 [Elysia chlorotica]|uniref:UspA domain-containing protein n=1 Tax=Elysia chlorotica TaxID=188477 RepID=A0A3S1B9R2_ELYCH|nr:hypothetical protein EGW08_013081 [Elysia chlorotica]